jgi:hypothetical protein
MENSELEVLKAKYGKVFTLTVPLDEDDASKLAVIYLKKPDRTTRGIVGKLAMQDSARAVEAALKALYIGGAKLDLITSNDDALAGCEESIVEILQVQKATLKKN